MKTILELIATNNSHGESLIHAIRDKLNSLVGGAEFPFQLRNSVSRENSQGSMYDLRSAVGLASNDTRAKEIRELLANLQQSGILAFEERLDSDKNTSIFVITHVDEDKFLNADTEALKVPNPIFSPNLEHETIRVGSHQIDVSYIVVKPAENYESQVLTTQVISDSTLPSENTGIINPSQLQTIASFLTVDKYLPYLVNLINTCMELDADSGFKLYLQSSNPDYPIDLRVYLPSGHPEIANVKAKLNGFSLLSNKAVIFEEKIATGTDVTIFIIKEIMPARLMIYLQALNQQDHKPRDLNGVVTLLQEKFPESALIQDLTVHTGISVSRPFPHIRCRNFYPVADVSNAIDLLAAVLGKPHVQGLWKSDQKPQSSVTPSESRGYRFYNAAPQESQLIIDINDFAQVEEKLRESLVVATANRIR